MAIDFLFTREINHKSSISYNVNFLVGQSRIYFHVVKYSAQAFCCSAFLSGRGEAFIA